jgi:hypothetical protein
LGDVGLVYLALCVQLSKNCLDPCLINQGDSVKRSVRVYLSNKDINIHTVAKTLMRARLQEKRRILPHQRLLEIMYICTIDCRSRYTFAPLFIKRIYICTRHHGQIYICTIDHRGRFTFVA